MFKNKTKYLTISAALAASALLLSGCANSNDNSMAGMDMGSMSGMSGMDGMKGMGNGSDTSPSPASSNTYGQLGDGDIMFAQMMIPHASQAIDMSTMALSSSQNKELKSLAMKLKTEQETEVAQITAWLASIGATSYGTQESEHQMPGMDVAGTVTDAQLTEMSGSSGTNFDKLFVKNMLSQLKGCLTMAEAVSTTTNSHVAKLAQSIIDLRTSEIAQLKAIQVK